MKSRSCLRRRHARVERVQCLPSMGCPRDASRSRLPKSVPISPSPSLLQLSTYIKMARPMRIKSRAHQDIATHSRRKCPSHRDTGRWRANTRHEHPEHPQRLRVQRQTCTTRRANFSRDVRTLGSWSEEIRSAKSSRHLCSRAWSRTLPAACMCLDRQERERARSSMRSASSIRVQKVFRFRWSTA